MKNKKINLLFATIMMTIPFLAGCSNKPQNNVTSTPTQSEVSSEEGKTTISQTTENTKKIVDLYALNDVHGRILENSVSYRHYEPGLARTSTYLKQLKQENENFIFLNSGDMFQDTYDSYANFGNLMAETMPLMGTEAMAIGNHEFDWGIDKLIKNKKLAGNTAFLGANIYHYDKVNKEVSDFASELSDEYKIVERSGMKIGIIGIIGKDQITSIMSKLVEDYIFLEPTPIVKRLSDKLKGEEGCDAVVVAAHADLEQLQTQSNAAFARELTSISPVTNQRYIDACFTAHTHKNQKDLYNEVPFIQSYCHGEQLGHIRLDLSGDSPKCVLFDSIDIPRGLQPDPAVQAVIDKYLNSDFYSKKNNTIGTTDIYKLSRHNAGNMLAWMTYDTLMEDINLPVEQIDVVLNNGGRSTVTLDSEELTRGVIFNALPFTNQTYVAEIKGYDILKQTQDYNYPYYAPNPITIDPNQTYTIAVIDYLLFHKNPEREFNYFTSFTGETLYCEPRYSCDLISDYIEKVGSISYKDITEKPGYQNILN